jgi:hypothetical protein
MTEIKIIKHSDIANCPKQSLAPQHYRDDGTCLCQHRPLHVIASDIRDHWTNVYFGAEPYLRTMSQLDKMTDMYGADSAETIVLYFVESNTKGWRGEDARRIKAELREMLKSVKS